MRIQGDRQSIREVFDNEFEIPKFQRPYSWGSDECAQLWDDLCSFIDNSVSEEYFLGSIVVYPEKKGRQKILCVIDGQQRLTTLLMLIHMFSEKVPGYTRLKEIVYKKDSKKTEVKTEPRVEPGSKREKEFLCAILNGEELKKEESEERDRFKENYQLLKGILEDWWKDKSPAQLEEIVDDLLDNIIILVINCGSEDEALTLFQTINDRGMALRDADIFKAEMYGVVEDEKDKSDDFIERWNKMNDHSSLFRSYMHIHRAERGDTDKEIALRKYFKSYIQKDLSNNLENIMINLEKCDWLEKNILSDNKVMHELYKDEEEVYWKQKVCWKILRNYPNAYCLYPLKVFFCIHTEYDAGTGKIDFRDKNKKEEYMDLIEYTIRYFLCKGVVHNRVTKVRGTSFNVCKLIASQEKKDSNINNIIAAYKKDVEDEKTDFEGKLKSYYEWPPRYRRCLMELHAFLNEGQDQKAYSAVLERNSGNRPTTQIEHILPRDMSKWPDKGLEKYRDNIGNLVIIEQGRNGSAGNQPFENKKEVYKNSEVQDVKDLVEKYKDWTGPYIEEREKKVLKRLKEFFDPIYSK